VKGKRGLSLRRNIKQGKGAGRQKTSNGQDVEGKRTNKKKKKQNSQKGQRKKQSTNLSGKGEKESTADKDIEYKKPSRHKQSPTERGALGTGIRRNDLQTREKKKKKREGNRTKS